MDPEDEILINIGWRTVAPGVYEFQYWWPHPSMSGICPQCVDYLKPCTRPGVESCDDFHEVDEVI
jgi:hypothetical protein